MYECKTYRGIMKQYLNQFSTAYLLNRFEYLLDDEYIRKVIIKELSNPNMFILSELEEYFNNGSME